jgi:glycolate oxidase iron-sulfur subunit
MQTELADWIKDTPDGQEADAILRRCVHCGFCTATCPTYQVLGDELDSPRGRIYLIKEMLEGGAVTQKTQLHLDRCLTCRNCETTCPSGVEYGKLIDIGRKIMEERVARPASERLERGLLKKGLTSPLFTLAVRAGQALKPMVPRALQHKIPRRRDPGPLPQGEHATKVLLLKGCVQPGILPTIDAATLRVLDAVGVQGVFAPGGGCCGALRFHLNDQEAGLADMRRNIDAWWPWVERGAVEAIVMNASGCGATVREYGHHLRHDPAYADKAARIADLTRDVAEYLLPRIEALQPRLAPPIAPRVAFHPPCTLQHWQKLNGVTEELLARCGFELLPFGETHLCCGSAGTYSILHHDIARRLRDRKLVHLMETNPQAILSANVGCIAHLQSGTQLGVSHWIEALDRCLRPAPS